jgi:nucleotide-binding universal stress UspA family protein
MVKHIVVAVSNNADCAALRFAIQFAREHDAYISVLHVVDWMPQFAMAESQDFGSLISCLEGHGREIVAEVSRKLEEAGCRGEAKMVTLCIRDFTVGKAIASFARKVDADLIVMGKGKTGWWRWFGEDTCAEVRRHAETKLLFASDAKPSACPMAKPFARLAFLQ